MTGLFNNQSLYIIGNGFDLYHQIPTSYANFGHYVSGVDQDLYRLLQDYFPIDGLWSDFENTLAYLDADRLIDKASTYLVPYSADDWSDAFHHDYQYEIDRIVSSLSTELKKRFKEWIRQVPIPTISSCTVPLLNLPLNTQYLTFNYTKTLQKLYGICPDQITHIHGDAESDPDLVLGHGVHPASIKSLNAGADFENQDVRITEANEIIDEYFSKTYKPTDRVIEDQQNFFDSLTEVERIYVLGHSLSVVDWPYFALIADKTKASNPNWIVSYRDDKKIQHLQGAFSELGLLATKVSYARITDIT